MRDAGLLFDPHFLGALHAELTGELGAEEARATLLQIGFLQGMRESQRVLEETSTAKGTGLGAARSSPLAIQLRILGGPAAFGAIALEVSWPERSEACAPLEGDGVAAACASPLKQITPANVKNLAPVWNLSLDNPTNASNQPLVIAGVMYVASHTHTIAIDAVTGRQKWKTAIELPADIAGYLCCGIHTRGMAALNGVLYRTTIDAHVMAISMADGKTIWKSKAAEYKDGYSMTHAPLIADGVLITGISGGVYGSRGFLDGWDLKTGEKKWRTWTVPAPGEKGSETWYADRYDKGGAPTWLTGSYDPVLKLVYWGTGNGGPWNPAWRGKDSLYICSILALDPATGKIVWHYQTSPGDPYDYDAVNELVLADLAIEGTPRKVLMQANRNGYFYMLDRTNGKLLSAHAFGKKINWASGIDMKTGRPVDEVQHPAQPGRRGVRVRVVPATTPAADVLALAPDGVFLSNGPGDPEPCDYAIEAIRRFSRPGCRCSATASATSCSGSPPGRARSR